MKYKIKILGVGAFWFLAVVISLLPLSVLAQDAAYAVVAVKNAKSLQLENGKWVRLASIQAPNVQEPGGRAGEPLGEQARAALASLVEGRRVTLTFAGKNPSTALEDRHGRWVAQLHDDTGRWIQAELLKSGWVMVYSFPGEGKLINEMLAYEKQARNQKRGIWAHDYYAVLDAQNVKQSTGRFRLVEGTVTEVFTSKGSYYINFGESWRDDFTLFISKRQMKYFPQGFAQALMGKRLRARGWVYEKNGPAIDITHPEQIELLSH